ncbi:MAG: hypothetical protein HW421_883 [Ignavibacteria bacterium]|nr:hypothetical protein [Ignavibacteria bacterium]
MSLLFNWDPNKAKSNLDNHNISFYEASSVFDDLLGQIFYDPEHSNNEERFIIIGNSKYNNLLFVSFTERKDLIRIISARIATKKERKNHEEK